MSSLAFSAGVVNQTFDPVVHDYAVIVGQDVTEVTINAAASRIESRLTIAGVTTGSNAGSVVKILIPGENSANIDVVAPDGATVQTYSTIIVRESVNQSCSFFGTSVGCQCDAGYVFNGDSGECVLLPS